MRPVDVVVELFRHNTLMNRRLLESCRTLSSEQLGTTAPGTYGTVAATLVHIANAQEGYAARLLDIERPERLTADPFPGLDTIAARLAHSDAQLEQAAARAGQDERTVKVTGDDPPGTWWMPVSLFLLQAINHGTEHRSQVATILTRLGVEAPAMDGWAYFFQSGHLVPV